MKDTESSSTSKVHHYEKVQEFNALVGWLHSIRYRAIIELFEKLSSEISERPIRVLEIGCAHAKLYRVLSERFDIDYVGVDVVASFTALAQERYGHHSNFRVVTGSAADPAVLATQQSPHVIVALETLEHIPEHVVVRIIENIAKQRPLRFVCSVPVEVGPIVWVKNVGSALMGYSRHKEYRWRETFWAGLDRLDHLPPHGTGHKGFDWRWLAQTIRHNVQTIEIRTFPFGLLPAGLSTSVFVVSCPYGSA
jgi:SAM-dependent methyltransferase